MARTGRVRRKRRRAGRLVYAAVPAVVALAIVGFVAALDGPEIEHRADNSWHYERITLTRCMAISNNYNQGISYSCVFATVPPRPFAIPPYVAVTPGSTHAPGSTTEWVHVVDGRIAGTDGTKAPLWSLAFLIIPVLMLIGFVQSVRAAHRAGRRWRDPRSG